MKKTDFKDYFYMLIGVILSAVAYSFFLVPAKINTGGISGISIVLHHLFKTPFGLVMFVLNIPLLIVGIKTFGRMFGVRTIAAVGAISVLSDFFAFQMKMFIYNNNNPILSAVYGGVFLGIGLGLIFKGKGSTGGSDIIGRIMNRYSNLSVGYAIFIVDSVIITISGLIFKNYELILYSFITLFLSSKVIDVVLEGRDYANGVFIFTTKPQEISDAVMEKLKRGVSGFNGVGMFMKEEKLVLYVVVSRREISAVASIAEEIDKDAFIVVSNVYEVMGKGFPRR